TMPRVSREAGETPVHLVSNVELIKRVRAPKGIRCEQRNEFERVVASAPADWFSPLHVPTLVRYCQHLATAPKIDAALEDALVEGDPVKIDLLLKAQARESKIILQLATALRLTPRATSPRGVSIKRLSTVATPWSSRLGEDAD